MRIYKLTTNKVSDTPMTIAGSFRAERTVKHEVYFSNKAYAENEAKLKRDAIQKLAGFFDTNIEFVVTEIDVIELEVPNE